MRPAYTITIPPVNKKSGEETATRLHRTRPAEKITIFIFWSKSGILLIECLPRGTTISGSCYASIIERLCCAILEERSGKVVLLLHDNIPVHKCNIVQTAIRKTGFVDLNTPAYSPDATPSDCQSCS